MTLLVKPTCLRQTLNIWAKLVNSKRHYSTFSQDHKFLSLLQSCKQTSETSQVHGFMVKTGLDNVPFTLSKLLASSIHDMEYAASIFKFIQNPNLFMFNTMLRGYSISDDPIQALGIFNHLRAQGIVLDQFSFVATLKVCARVLGIVTGQGIHGVVLRSGHGLFINVKNTLLHLYCVCGRSGDAHKLFDEFPQRNDLVSWNSLMGGYVHACQPSMVLDLFCQMCWSGLRASVTTVLSVLSATGDFGNLLGGESLHGHCIRVGFCSDLNVVTALIDMYAKTGNIELGRRVFDEVAEKDVVLWNCLIDKYARSGMVEKAVALLSQMKLQRVKPNSSTLAGLLSACAASGAINVGRCINDYVKEEKMVLDVVLGTALVDIHGGLVTEGTRCFERMVSEYGLSPKVEHYGCLIDLLGRAGLLEEAHKLIKSLPIKGDATAWRSLLAACRVYGNVKLGECVMRVLANVYDEHPTDSILLSSTYAIAGRLPEERRMQEMEEENIMKEVKCKSVGTEEEKEIKEAGCSIIEMDSQWWEPSWENYSN
ncbi:pentatricopeptide repeat-containing protein At1g26900, mitochondrial [Fagus crenata]